MKASFADLYDIGYEEPGLPPDLVAHLSLWAKFLELSVADACFQFLKRKEKEAELGHPIDPYEAEEWFSSDDTEPGTFVWACELFGFDPDAVRRVTINRRREFAVKSVRIAG